MENSEIALKEKIEILLEAWLLECVAALRDTALRDTRRGAALRDTRRGARRGAALRDDAALRDEEPADHDLT